MITLGGRQFWGDVYFFHRWRIQQQVHTQRYRLLDHRDWCFAAGSFETCREHLQQRIAQGDWEASTREGVILLHGILRTSKSFKPMQKSLEQAGYEAFPVDYPSTQLTIEEAADQLQRVLESLQELPKVHLVGHSMGGLIIRTWFGKYGSADTPKPPMGRVVFIGTPNQGAELADLLRNFPPYRLLFGKAGLELGIHSERTDYLLSVPSVPYAVIAGGRGEGTNGFNPLLPGDDDGTVTIASAHLQGEQDFLRIPCLHMSLMRHPKAIQGVKSFLTEGKFQQVVPSSPVPVSDDVSTLTETAKAP